MFGRLGPPELIIILVILLLLFGATRLPRLMRSMGEGVKEFRKGVSTPEEGGKKGRGRTRSKAKKA